MATTWAQSNGNGVNRRALLFKVSAALSLASTSPALADDAEAHPTTLVAPVDDFFGIWHSRYVYPSTGRAQNFTGELRRWPRALAPPPHRRRYAR